MVEGGEEVGLDFFAGRAGSLCFVLRGFLAAARGSLVGVLVVDAVRGFLADGFSSGSSDLRFCCLHVNTIFLSLH